jgi:hypothetical protein
MSTDLKILFYYFAWVSYQSLRALTYSCSDHVLSAEWQILVWKLIILQEMLWIFVRNPKSCCTWKWSSHGAHHPLILRNTTGFLYEVNSFWRCLDSSLNWINWKQSKVNTHASWSTSYNWYKCISKIEYLIIALVSLLSYT